MAANLEINVVSKDELSVEEIISMIRKKYLVLNGRKK